MSLYSHLYRVFVCICTIHSKGQWESRKAKFKKLKIIQWQISLVPFMTHILSTTLSLFFYFCCMLAISNLLLMDFFLWILSIEYLTVVMFVAEIAHCLPQNREQIFIEYFQSSIEFNWKVKYEQGLPFWWRLHCKSIKGKKLNKGERWREKKRQHEKHEH